MMLNVNGCSRECGEEALMLFDGVIMKDIGGSCWKTQKVCA